MKKLSTLLLIAAVAAGIDANSAEVTRIAAGDHTMLLTKDGKIYVSGKNDAGQLGDGHYSLLRQRDKRQPLQRHHVQARRKGWR